MATLFVLQHLRKDPDGYDNLKLIGVFSSEDLAKKVLESHRALLGFVDYPNGFDLAKYELDQGYWTEGFVDPRQQLP
jgi:hypothetical protein